MANNQSLPPSSSTLVGSSSSLPSRQTPSTRTRLPVSYYPEIWNLILHFAFIPHLPPDSLRERIEEPPSLAPLLPLTLVCKGLRELALPLLYKNLTVRRAADWTLLLHPTEGLLVGEGTDQRRRRASVKRLSFAPRSFPSSWTPSKLRAAGSNFGPDLVMAPLDFSPLRGLEEVCVGPWGSAAAVVKENIEATLKSEIAVGTYLWDWLKMKVNILSSDVYWRHEMEARNLLESVIDDEVLIQQASSLVRLLDLARPAVAHFSLTLLELATFALIPPFGPLFGAYGLPLGSSFDLYIHRNPILSKRLELRPMDTLSAAIVGFKTQVPSAKINVDFALSSTTMLASFYALGEVHGWSRDLDGWWTWKEPAREDEEDEGDLDAYVLSLCPRSPPLPLSSRLDTHRSCSSVLDPVLLHLPTLLPRSPPRPIPKSSTPTRINKPPSSSSLVVPNAASRRRRRSSSRRSRLIGSPRRSRRRSRST